MTSKCKKPLADPLFRWAGSKRKLLPRLLQLVPSQFKSYIEPFAGSACLYFALLPRTAILGDLNSELIETYEVIRRHPKKLGQLLESYPTTSTFYYTLRGLIPSKLSDVERASRFIFLNRYCFNGLFRTNRNGQFNVPMGTNTGRLPSISNLAKAANRLKDVQFHAGDFETTLGKARKGDFIYLDPPYADSNRVDRNEYGNGSFSPNDLERLVKALKRLDAKGITFLLSYSMRKEFTTLLPEWNKTSLSVSRHIAGFVEHRRKAKEILVSNHICLNP